MGESETAAALIRRLLAEIRADRRALHARVEDVRRFSTEVPEDRLAERSAALALALDRVYSALESILERVARTLEGGLPVGADWHRELLHDSTLDIPEVRPPVLHESSSAAADQLRRFRHFLRHAYAAELDSERVRQLAATWLAAVPSLAADLDRFEQFLVELAARLERAS